MKQSKTTKKLLAVMMSFLMAFSSVQGYIKAEDSTETTNEDTENQIIDVNDDEIDPDFSVDYNEDMDFDSEIDSDNKADDETDTGSSDDAIEEATKGDTAENATPSDTDEVTTPSDAATNGDATPSDAEQVIVPEVDYEWEDVEGAQINGSMNMRFLYRSAAMPTTGEGIDVTDAIEVVYSKATIDGKTITNGAAFDINTSSTFAFEFEWCAADQDKTFNAGDTMTINIGTIKGLNYDPKTDPVTLYISGVKVGSYYLTYDATSGELAFHIEFRDNIGYFQNIGGYFRGSAKLNKIAEETLEPIKFMDSTTGEITWKPVKPVNPINPDAGANLWKPAVPDYDFNYNEKSSIIKGRKKAGNVVNEVHYMVGFFDLVKRYEAGEPGDKYNYEYVIIEDELDENQVYNLNYKKENAPFYVEVPLFYYGTNSAVAYEGTGKNNSVVINTGNNDKQAGETHSAISSSIFTQITDGTSEEIELKVKNTPKSWGIVTTNTGTQKLIVNVGKLGSTNKQEAITMSDITKSHFGKTMKFEDLLKAVEDKVAEAKNAIKEYIDETNSPKANLEKAVDEFKALYKDHKDLVTVEKYIESIKKYMNDETIVDIPVLNKVIEPDKDQESVAINVNNVEILNEDAYKNLNSYLSNYRTDTKKYNENKATYIEAWSQRLDVLNKTLEYYNPELYKGDFPIYGIILRYSSTITNLSQKVIGNKVNISTDAIEFSESISFEHEFTAGIKGNYTNGDVVLVKADSRYGYNEEDLGTSKVTGMEGVQFQVFKEGSTTPIKFMDSALNADKHYLYIAGNHEGDPNFTDTLVTDINGTIALSALPTNINYYFKEVSAVDGYYGDQNQHISFNVDKSQVTYKLAENISRAITLKKVDAETKEGLEGVTFAIYDKETNTELTGFAKDGDVYLYDKKGNEELKTNKEGILEVRNLPAGEFYMKETKALDGYKPIDEDENNFPFELSKDLIDDVGAIIKVNNGNDILNHKQIVSLKVIKKGSDDKLLAGVEFELHAASDDKLIEKYVTNNDGEILIYDLDIGNYYLIETKGKDGYEFDSAIRHDVNIENKADTIEKVIINQKKVIPPTPVDPNNPDTPVNPVRPVDPNKPEVDIPDEDVPLGPGEDIVDIEEEDVPLSDGGDNAFVEIEEENVPLGSGVPNTGDGLYFWIPAMLISMLALGILNGLRRRLSK